MEIRSERSTSGNENMEISFSCSMRMRCRFLEGGLNMLREALKWQFEGHFYV